MLTPKEIPFNGNTEVHYFEKEVGNETRFFTIVADKATKIILRSSFRNPGADDGKHMDDCIQQYSKEGFTHHTI